MYLPNFLFAMGQGAVTPVIALVALDLGSSIPVAGAILGLQGLGTMIFNIPAGVLISRFGEGRSMAVATAVLVGVAIGIGFGPSLWLYGTLVFFMGGAWSVWLLVRLAYATESSPLGYRGRVMAVIGGMGRTGHFLGSLIGGLTVIAVGLLGPFIIQALSTVAATLTVTLTETSRPTFDVGESNSVTIKRVIGDHLGILWKAGFVAMVMQVLRSSRQAIIPLWGNQIGIGPGQISLIFSVSSAVESVLFYPVGILMDRKGRRWAATLSMFLLSIGVASIPFTSDLAALTKVALLLGLANGLGTGINMTLGTDLSPSIGRNQFLGVWRLVSDIGTAGGPLLVAVTTSVASFGVAAFVVGGVGALGLTVLWLGVPETLTGRARSIRWRDE